MNEIGFAASLLSTCGKNQKETCKLFHWRKTPQHKLIVTRSAQRFTRHLVKTLLELRKAVHQRFHFLGRKSAKDRRNNSLSRLRINIVIGKSQIVAGNQKTRDLAAPIRQRRIDAQHARSQTENPALWIALFHKHFVCIELLGGHDGFKRTKITIIESSANRHVTHITIDTHTARSPIRRLGIKH